MIFGGRFFGGQFFWCLIFDGRFLMVDFCLFYFFTKLFRRKNHYPLTVFLDLDNLLLGLPFKEISQVLICHEFM